MSDSPDTAMPATRKVFTVLGEAAEACSPRLGRLSLPGRQPIQTPNFSAVASRGTIPHITPDNLSKHTSTSSVYMALEDFIEKKNPPIYNTPESAKRRLHSYTALPSDILTILAVRRCPAVGTPAGNAAKAMAIFTSTGFDKITVPQYATAVRSLQPDIAVSMADLHHTSKNPPSRKLLRMAERTEDWTEELLATLTKAPEPAGKTTAMFAPVLDVDHAFQWSYLKSLASDSIDTISGLALYGTKLLPELANYPALTPLPKLSLDPPSTPQGVLEQVSLGMDLILTPFVNAVSDAGVAMVFDFPPPQQGAAPLAMGDNIWEPENVTSLTPLKEGCKCYACTKHTRAYIHHLLNAKEMLGWNLLQIHNHAVVESFFEGIRQALAQGAAAYEQAKGAFVAAYEDSFPEGTGERPRARGYHFKSEGGDEKINKTTWRELQEPGGNKENEAVATVA